MNSYEKMNPNNTPTPYVKMANEHARIVNEGLRNNPNETLVQDIASYLGLLNITMVKVLSCLAALTDMELLKLKEQNEKEVDA